MSDPALEMLDRLRARLSAETPPPMPPALRAAIARLRHPGAPQMPPRAIADLADAVHDRSGGRCEAVWAPGYRCRNRADVLHHRLPRARGRVGAEMLLDLARDVDNLAHLCRPCHDDAHGNPERAQAAAASGDYGSAHPSDVRRGLIVPGEVRTGPDGRIIYTGPDPAYAARYPQEPTG